MKKILLLTFIPVLALVFSVSAVSAQTTEPDPDTELSLTQSQFEMLIQLIEALQLQIDIADLEDKLVRQDLRDDVREIRDFARDMYEGMTSEEVTDLQEILSGYSDIYPEGIVSGYFGPLTKQAVKRFQKRLGIDDTGYVGPLTRRALNDLIDDGEISDEEAAMLPEGIRNGRGLDKPLPPGIYKNIKERRGFAKGNKYGWDDDSDDSDSDEDSDDEYSEEDADEAIKDAQDAIDEAQSEIDEAIENDEDADLVEQAEGLLEDAEAKLVEAQDAFDEDNWEDAEKLADEAEDLADEAEDLFEDDSDEDDDEDDDEEDEDDDEDDDSNEDEE